METTQYSDTPVSVTMDAFETMCVSNQIYTPIFRYPGSGKRLRYVPPDLLTVIGNIWKTSLRTSVKRAITELSKSDQTQSSVLRLREIEQRIEEVIEVPEAGPFCVQILHEAASIIGSEAAGIASSLPSDKCLAILEKQIQVVSTE